MITNKDVLKLCQLQSIMLLEKWEAESVLIAFNVHRKARNGFMLLVQRLEMHNCLKQFDNIFSAILAEVQRGKKAIKFADFWQDKHLFFKSNHKSGNIVT